VLVNEAPLTYARVIFLFKPSASPAKAGIRFTQGQYAQFVKQIATPVVLRMNNRGK